MSEVMQQGILRMPPECWMNGEPLDERQRHSAYVAAADRILELEDENAALRSLLREAIREHVDPYDLPEGDDYIARVKTALGEDKP